eukprot:scaffold565_cov379-Pinguiococcus_pyrenoidosus.AAC.4
MLVLGEEILREAPQGRALVPVLVFLHKLRCDGIVADVHLRHGEDLDAAVHAAEPPVVLVLEPGPLGEPRDFQHNRVLVAAVLDVLVHQIGDLELARRHAVLRVADRGAIDVHLDVGASSADAQADATILLHPPRRHDELAAIVAAWIVTLQVWIVHAKRVLKVGVQGRLEPLHLPRGRHRNAVHMRHMTSDDEGLCAVRAAHRLQDEFPLVLVVQQHLPGTASAEVPRILQRRGVVVVKRQRRVRCQAVPSKAVPLHSSDCLHASEKAMEGQGLRDLDAKSGQSVARSEGDAHLAVHRVVQEENGADQQEAGQRSRQNLHDEP